MPQRIAIVGAGWAGLAAAVGLTSAGHAVTVFEAARTAGGRARRIDDAAANALDNGQHILIGAYTETLRLMRAVGADPQALLHRQPLSLRYPDGSGLQLPDWPAPLDIAWGVLRSRGWRLSERLALLRTAAQWRAGGFACDAAWTVQRLCRHLPARVREELIEPLCVSALNTPMAEASAQVFLTVLRDALLGPRGSSHLLIPRHDLGTLLPDPAMAWLQTHGAEVAIGQRVESLAWQAAGAAGDAAHPHHPRQTWQAWQVQGHTFDAVVLATPPWEAARLVERLADTVGTAAGEPWAATLHDWSRCAAALRHEAIATVYARGGPVLAQPMLSLRSGPGAPAQFVFDRAWLAQSARQPADARPRHDDHASPGIKAFVVSASTLEREELTRQVIGQAHALGWHDVTAVQTVVEKRATFACTPGLKRPALAIAPGLWACGDYTEGPYPATLEGAVRSGLAVAARITGRSAG